MLPGMNAEAIEADPGHWRGCTTGAARVRSSAQEVPQADNPTFARPHAYELMGRGVAAGASSNVRRQWLSTTGADSCFFADRIDSNRISAERLNRCGPVPPGPMPASELAQGEIMAPRPSEPGSYT